MTLHYLPIRPVEPRAEPTRDRKRESLFLLARMQIAGLEPMYEVRVRNLSEGGLMAEYPQPIPVGTPIAVYLGGIGLVPGRVAWCESQRVGMAFDQPIDPRLARKPAGGRAAIAPAAKAPPRD